MERFAYSCAIGLGIAAYGVLLIGLCGFLSFWPVTLMWLGLAVGGWRGVVDNNTDLAAFARQLVSGIASVSVRRPGSFVSVLGALSVCIVACVAVASCFKPPASLEWDAISYHLADPRLFLMAHRISSLPTEHHSNFPFLMEMLYTVGLMYEGYALANLMHLVMTALTAVAMFGFCRRIQGSVCGWIAVILFVSTPVVLWESSVAYVEMGLGLFTTLAVLAAVRGLSGSLPHVSAKDRNQWINLCGICIGFALGVKYLALVPFGLILLFVVFRSRSVRSTLLYATIALSVASPWYIKNIVVTHNPVYPYYFKLFPNSTNWSANRAAGYESEQARFGATHSLKQPATAASNLLQTPWDLLTLPLSNRGTYSNEGEFSFMTLIGGLCFAFNALVLLRRRIHAEMASVLAFGILQIAAWFFVAQVSRYLVSVLPLLAISGAYGSAALIDEIKANKNTLSATVARVALALSAILLAAQFVSLLWVVTLGAPQLTAVSLPQLVDILQSPDGVRTYLRRRLDTYAVTDWINTNTDRRDGVLIYDDTRGFYLERPYMWANEEHSAFIPYGKFKDGRELTDWMISKHFRYAMFDMNWAPQKSDATHPDPDLPSGPDRNESEAFQKWYASAPLQPVDYSGYRWRGLVGDAVRRGLWTDVGVAQHGVMLMRIGPNEPIGTYALPDSGKPAFVREFH